MLNAAFPTFNMSSSVYFQIRQPSLYGPNQIFKVKQVQNVQAEQDVDVEPQLAGLAQAGPLHNHVHRLGAKDLGGVKIQHRRIASGQLGVMRDHKLLM